MVLQTEVQQVPHNQIPNDPELADLLQLAKKLTLLELNCHHIATIQSFDTAAQTAKATVNYKRTYFEPDPLSGEYMPKQVDYAILVDCPVIFLGGGNAALTFPVAAGDECLVFFNDRDIDNWFSGSSSSSLATPRLHSYADAILLVGIRSLARVLPEFSSTDIELFNGTTKLSIAPSGDLTLSVPIGTFTFKANADVEFDTGTVQGLFGNGGKVSFTNAMGEMIDLLNTMFTALTTASAGGFPLIIPPDFATALTKFTSFKA